MSQCLLNSAVQSHQHYCDCIHIERRASSFRHARSHAFSSSKVTSSSSSFAGTSLRASFSHKVVTKHQSNANAVRCQATSDKMVIAVTGKSSSSVLHQNAHETHAQADSDRTAGATGLVGSRLVSRLSAQGHTVRVLTRNPDKARGKLPYARIRFYNIQQQLQEALKGATGVVNLAGTVTSSQHTPHMSAHIAPHMAPHMAPHTPYGMVFRLRSTDVNNHTCSMSLYIGLSTVHQPITARSLSCLYIVHARQQGINCLKRAATTVSTFKDSSVLTGEPIATRWSASLKREIKASRVTTTTNLVVSLTTGGQREEDACCLCRLLL